jgi:hypothetical protein
MLVQSDSIKRRSLYLENMEMIKTSQIVLNFYLAMWVIASAAVPYGLTIKNDWPPTTVLE